MKTLKVNNTEFNGQSNVATWYAAAFPHDEWGCENINKGITFQDVFNCLQAGADFYAFIGAGDSVVRERVFDALATLMGVGYEYIYYRWLNNGEEPQEHLTDLSGLRFKKAEAKESGDYKERFIALLDEMNQDGNGGLIPVMIGEGLRECEAWSKDGYLDYYTVKAIYRQ